MHPFRLTSRQQFPQIKVERGQVDKYMIPWDKTDWSPRVGFAWEAMDRTVVRAGYGMFYGGEENQGGNPNRGESVPFNQSTSIFSRGPRVRICSQRIRFFAGGLSAGYPINVFSLPAPVSFRGVATNFRNGLVHKWNVAIQRELGFNTSLEVAYIGSKGQRLLNLNDPQQPSNAPTPGSSYRPASAHSVSWIRAPPLPTPMASPATMVCPQSWRRLFQTVWHLLAPIPGHMPLTNVGTIARPRPRHAGCAQLVLRSTPTPTST